MDFAKIRLPDAPKPGWKVLSSVARNNDQPIVLCLVSKELLLPMQTAVQVFGNYCGVRMIQARMLPFSMPIGRYAGFLKLQSRYATCTSALVQT